MLQSRMELSQERRYQHFYGNFVEFGAQLRLGVHYRGRRLPEVLSELGIATDNRRVLDSGFGGGELLASVPASCEITGVDVSTSAVIQAGRAPRFTGFKKRTFSTI